MNNNEAITLLQDAADRADAFLEMAQLASTDARAIVRLLKEQETKQVKQVELYGQEDWYGLVCKCPDCKAIWMGSKSETHFCPNCGQTVKWNDIKKDS